MIYVWIWMLAIPDVIWLISSIVDVVRTIKYIKEHRRYGSVGDFINCMEEELEESTVSFVVLHICILFIVSLFEWAIFKMGG